MWWAYASARPMSDTQAAMHEFRFLEERRTTIGLTPAEEQRWQELAQQLGVDLNAHAQANAPQGYYGPDGQWYPYAPQGYDPQVWGGPPGAWQGYYPPQPQGYYGPDGQWYQSPPQYYPPQPQGYYGPDGQWYQAPPQPAGYYGPDGRWYPAAPQPQWDPQAQQWVQPPAPQWDPQAQQWTQPAAPQQAPWGPPQEQEPVQPQPQPQWPEAAAEPAPTEGAAEPQLQLAPEPTPEPAPAQDDAALASSDEVMEIGDEEVVEIPPTSAPNAVQVEAMPAPSPALAEDPVAALRDALSLDDDAPAPAPVTARPAPEPTPEPAPAAPIYEVSASAIVEAPEPIPHTTIPAFAQTTIPSLSLLDDLEDAPEPPRPPMRVEPEPLPAPTIPERGRTQAAPPEPEPSLEVAPAPAPIAVQVEDSPPVELREAPREADQPEPARPEPEVLGTIPVPEAPLDLRPTAPVVTSTELLPDMPEPSPAPLTPVQFEPAPVPVELSPVAAELEPLAVALEEAPREEVPSTRATQLPDLEPEPQVTPLEPHHEPDIPTARVPLQTLLQPAASEPQDAEPHSVFDTVPPRPATQEDVFARTPGLEPPLELTPTEARVTLMSPAYSPGAEPVETGYSDPPTLLGDVDDFPPAPSERATLPPFAMEDLAEPIATGPAPIQLQQMLEPTAASPIIIPGAPRITSVEPLPLAPATDGFVEALGAFDIAQKSSPSGSRSKTPIETPIFDEATPRPSALDSLAISPESSVRFDRSAFGNTPFGSSTPAITPARAQGDTTPHERTSPGTPIPEEWGHSPGHETTAPAALAPEWGADEPRAPANTGNHPDEWGPSQEPAAPMEAEHVDLDVVLDASLDGSPADPIQLATPADFVAPPAPAPDASNSEDLPIEADLGEFVVESVSVAALATGVSEFASNDVDGAPLQLAQNADFIDHPALQATGEARKTDSAVIPLEEEAVEGEVISGELEIEVDHGRESWGGAVSAKLANPPPPPPVSAPAAARPVPHASRPSPRPLVPPLASPPRPAVSAPTASAARVAAAQAPAPPVSTQPFDLSGAPLRQDDLPVVISGEHRVILHTVEGGVKRGSIRDCDLSGAVISLATAPGTAETVQRERAKAVFFMLAPGSRAPAPEGQKVRVTFRDGRQVAGFSKDFKSLAVGFFVVPADNRTNTERIFIYRHAVSAVTAEHT